MKCLNIHKNIHCAHLCLRMIGILHISQCILQLTTQMYNKHKKYIIKSVILQHNNTLCFQSKMKGVIYDGNPHLLISTP